MLASPPAARAVAPQLTARAIATGMILGAALSLSNVYVGLRIGWSFGVSLTATVLAHAAWRALAKARLTRAPSLLENTIAQTCAGAAGYMASSGLNSAIPAMAMIAADGLAPALTIAPWTLALWIASVSAFGLFVAAAMKRALLDREDLRFPSGTACAETLRTMYEDGDASSRDARLLALAAIVAAAWKTIVDAPPKLREAMTRHGLALLAKIPSRLGAPIDFGGRTLGDYGFGLPLGLLLFAVGAIVGPRVGASLAIGALVSYGLLGPRLVAAGVVHATDARVASAIRTTWSVWPGASLLVAANLVSLAFVVKRAWPKKRSAGAGADAGAVASAGEEVPARAIALGLAVTGAIVIALERLVFDLPIAACVAAIAFSALASVVAARATGVTDVPPVGPLGKLAQLAGAPLTFGAPIANLAFANASTGAAAHAAELLTDLKTGKLVGASPRKQLVAQGFGVVAGSLACVPAYLALAKTSVIGGRDLPAPAAAAWKATAEVLARGASSLPPYAVLASAVAAAIGAAIAFADELSPARVRRFLPSATGLGIALLIDAEDSFAIFLGAMLALAIARRARKDAVRAIAAGVLAGEGLAGIALAVARAWT